MTTVISKQEFDLHASVIAQNSKNAGVVRDYQASSLRRADDALFVTRNISGMKNIKFTQPSDKRTVGVCNVADGKTKPNQIFLVTHVQVLVATVAGTAAITDEVIAGIANFTSPASNGPVRNGHLTIKSDGQPIIQEEPIEVFVNDNDNTQKLGVFKLREPKMLYADSQVSLEAEFGVAAPDRTVMKIVLYGSGTIS